MCITFLYTNSDDPSYKYKLILINNRDEFYSRKTLKAQIIREDDGLVKIYGTDVETKVLGTWLAISKRGDTIRIGNLLNVPGEVIKGLKKTELKGRGPIAIDYVRTCEDIEKHNQELCNVCTYYNSFNFLSLEIKSNDIKTYFISNTSQHFVALPTGFYGFSNSPVDSPLQKVIKGREQFITFINQHKGCDDEKLINDLLELLKSDEKHFPDEELSKRHGYKEDSVDFSSIHVRYNQFYGTRTRTVILVDQDDNIEYIEETMVNQDPEKPIWEQTRLKVKRDGSAFEE